MGHELTFTQDDRLWPMTQGEDNATHTLHLVKDKVSLEVRQNLAET